MRLKYAILDTRHLLYKQRIATLTKLHAMRGINFVPRMSLDGTEALIQIKFNHPDFDWLVHEGDGILGSQDKDVTQKQDEQWARETLAVDKTKWEAEDTIDVR